jgi:hypothetical protein
VTVEAHDAPCPDCRRYVIAALTAGPHLTDNERRAAIREAADHLVRHVEEARAA